MFFQIRVALLVIAVASLCAISGASPACHADPAVSASTIAQVEPEVEKSKSQAMAKAMDCCRERCGMRDEEIDPENPCRMCADHGRESSSIAFSGKSGGPGACSQACIEAGGEGKPIQAPLAHINTATTPKALLDRWHLADSAEAGSVSIVAEFSPAKDPALDLPDPPPKAL